MRLAIVTHKIVFGDGQGRVNYEIARRMLDGGHEVILVCNEVDPVLEQSNDVSVINIGYGKLPSNLLRYRTFARRSRNWLRLNRHRFDVVLVNGAVTSFPSDVNAVHFVHTGWRASPHYSPGGGLRGLYQRLYTAANSAFERAAFARTRKIVAVSNTVAREIERTGVPAQDIRVITNGVDLGAFVQASPNRSKYGLPIGEVIALFAGDIRTPRKNLDTVLHALQRVDGLHLAVAGRLAGSPYPALARSLGVQDRVHFLDFCNDMPGLVRSIDFLAFPSRYEPFALVLLEAMAGARPVVTARTVGGAEIMDALCGIVIDDPNDVEGLAGAFARLVADPALRDQMASAALNVARKHSWRSMADQYVDLVEELYGYKSSSWPPTASARD